jgi:methionyl-tRNA formyltransferase
VISFDTGVVVACADGALELIVVQPEGKARMSALDWARGYQVKVGSRLE